MADMSPPVLQLAHCTSCGAWTFPADAHGCRRCGAAREQLRAEPCPAAPRLRNAITLHTALHPDLPAPCVIGEVELAPGVVEEALIDVADEAMLAPGAELDAVADPLPAGGWRWRFVPRETAR